MVTKLFSFIARSLAWCFLLSITLASMEALGYYSIHGVKNPLSWGEFVQYFSNASAVLLCLTFTTWIILWILMVGLGGARFGIALLFIMLFYVVFGYLNVLLDFIFAFTDRFAAYWSILLTDFAYIAFILAAVVTLIVSKIFRRMEPRFCSLRVLVFPVFLLVAFALTCWVRNVLLTQVQPALFLGLFAACLIVFLLFLWQVGRRPWLLNVFLAAAFIAVLSPIPYRHINASHAPDSTFSPMNSTATRPIKHVILITIDTLRRDALGCFNPDSSNSPHLDRFARDCALFTNAFSSAPWTYPSMASILTGLPPHVHQLVDGKCALSEKTPTLASDMREAGYHTAALGFNGLLLPRSKLNRGFEEYHWYPIPVFSVNNFNVGLTHNLMNLVLTIKPDATMLTDEAVRWFTDNSKRDFLFWLHYFDPHMPYKPPEPFQPTDSDQQALGSHFKDVRAARMGSLARTQAERAWVRELYDGEIRYMDEQLGRLFDSLKKLGLYEDSLILLTSDHGEEFWDHDHFEHGHTLYNELIHVPFLIKLPKGQAAATIDAQVSTQAIMPTILDLCEIQSDTMGLLLAPLSPALLHLATPYSERPLLSAATIFHDHLEAIIFDRFKYIRGTTSGHEWLFNLEEDPGEHNSIAPHDLEHLNQGRELLDEALRECSRLQEELGLQPDEKDLLHQQDIQHMQALGYM